MATFSSKEGSTVPHARSKQLRHLILESLLPLDNPWEGREYVDLVPCKDDELLVL